MDVRGMNRATRRAARSMAKRKATTFPAELTKVRREEWPTTVTEDEKRTQVWLSREFIVQVYDEAPQFGHQQVRISVNRAATTLSGDYAEGISWEDLQRIKRAVGFGTWYGVEVFPPDADIVNVANMRHLWLFNGALPIGWGDAANLAREFER